MPKELRGKDLRREAVAGVHPLRTRMRLALESLNEVLRIARSWPGIDSAALQRADTFDGLQRLASASSVIGFNGQVVRLKYLLALFRAVQCTSFLETGTRFGATALTASRLFQTQVRTVEINGRALFLAKLASLLTRTRGVEFEKGDSRQALSRWLRDPAVGARPMIYLDAHWLNDHPLRSEVSILLDRGNCVVVIDDFRVEHDPGFGYDSQAVGSNDWRSFTVELAAIKDLLSGERILPLLPAHRSEDETGLRRGTMILLVDVPLPPIRDHFTASLFAPVGLGGVELSPR